VKKYNRGKRSGKGLGELIGAGREYLGRWRGMDAVLKGS
jgi:hypothetical protein